MLESHFGDFVLFNIYFPLGDKGQLDYKLKFYSDFIAYLAKFKDKKVIICGDFNIAHKDIDLNTEWSGVGTFPQERALLDKLIDLGFVDSFRAIAINAGAQKCTWISHANRNAKNYVGLLRLDYAFISQNLCNVLKNAIIIDSSFSSDHNPIGVEIDL